MKNRSASHDLAAFPSPGAPQYRGNGPAGLHKGWSSERIQVGPAGRQIVGPAGFSSGRAALPSKWEDAERWICSPLNGGNKSLSSQAFQKRPKSKSGPIAHTAGGGGGGGGGGQDAAGGSPFSTGVLAAESVYYGRLPLGSAIYASPDMKEAHCCPSPKIRLSGEADEIMSGAAEKSEVSQRDMATQMSRRDCRCSTYSTGSQPALFSIVEQQTKSQVRDVVVDKRATVIQSGPVKTSKKSQHFVDDFGQNSGEISEAAINNSSKWEREEAKITAWENLQKAKAEAEIRKLEMKLEKKRSAMMDKIVEKLRSAEFEAHKMRSKLSDDQDDDQNGNEILRSPRKSSFQKSLRSLFTCRNF